MVLLFLALLGLLRWASATAADVRGHVSKTVHFEITLTWENVAPDGFERKAILTNGQFPAPTLELDQGDDVEFVVYNLLPFETTIHFHVESFIFFFPFSPFPPLNSSCSGQFKTESLYRNRPAEYTVVRRRAGPVPETDKARSILRIQVEGHPVRELLLPCPPQGTGRRRIVWSDIHQAG